MKRQNPETGISYATFTSNPVKARLRAGVTVPKSKGGNRTATQGFACIKIDLECGHCYAASVNKLFGTGLDFTRENLDKVEFYVDHREFKKWRNLQRKIAASLDVTERPRIFIGDMLDLCLGSPEDDDRDGVPLALKCVGLQGPQLGIPFEWLDQIFANIAQCPDITFLLLTKRPKRLLEYAMVLEDESPLPEFVWPLPNVHIGVTCGHSNALHRVETLLTIPAAHRWISAEPLLEPISFLSIVKAENQDWEEFRSRTAGMEGWEEPTQLVEECEEECDWINYGDDLVTSSAWREWKHEREVYARSLAFGRQIQTVVTGGESGGKPRPFEWKWARLIVNQLERKNGGASIWVKQGGGVHPPKKLADFPEDLRIRQWGGSR